MSPDRVRHVSAVLIQREPALFCFAVDVLEPLGQLRGWDESRDYQAWTCSKQRQAHAGSSPQKPTPQAWPWAQPYKPGTFPTTQAALTSSRNTWKKVPPWSVRRSLCSTVFFARFSIWALDLTANFWNVRLREPRERGRRGMGVHAQRTEPSRSCGCERARDHASHPPDAQLIQKTHLLARALTSTSFNQ